MDFEKLAEASHQAWFVAMARHGWVFGPRLSQEFKTHPWLKPYPGLNDQTKEIVRAQVRGILQALEQQGVNDVKGLTPAAPPAPIAMGARAVVNPPESPAQQKKVAVPEPGLPRVVTAQVPQSPQKNAPQPSGDTQTLERRVDASGRMRIGSGLVKKAELLREGVSQVTIVQAGNCIEVVPYDPGVPGAFYASVNPDGFMLPKAMLAGAGSQDFTLTILPGRLVVRPK